MNEYTVFYAFNKNCKGSSMIAAWSSLQLIASAPFESSLGGSNLKIQIQSHFKKMDYEDSAVYSFVKTKFTLLDHNKRFLVICFSLIHIQKLNYQKSQLVENSIFIEKTRMKLKFVHFACLR